MLQMQTRFENIEMFLAHGRITALTLAERINPITKGGGHIVPPPAVFCV